jgi:hypothetical protein
MNLTTLTSKAAGLAVSQALKDLALREECLDRVGRHMYEKEEELAIDRPWVTLPVVQKRIWRERAQAAIIGLLAYATER